MSFLDAHEPPPEESNDWIPDGTDLASGVVPPDEDDAVAAHAGEVRSAFLDWFHRHLLTLEPVNNDWCPQWWKHPEAVARLFALWLAWEEATGKNAHLSDRSSWWVYHWGHHGPILLDRKNGPFRDCDMQRGHLERAARDHVRVVMDEHPPQDWSPEHRAT